MKHKFTFDHIYNNWEIKTNGFRYQIMNAYCVITDTDGRLLEVEEFNTTAQALETMEGRLNR